MSRLDQKLELAFAPLATAVQTGRIPGGVLGIIDNTGNRVMRSLGAAQLVPQHREMTDNTWFDLASLTKVIFTTQRILALADAGRIDLDAPLISVLPDFRQYNPDNWERRVTFRQCLGHQTPFPAVFPLYTYGRDPQLLRAFLLQHQWEAGPAVYSDINFLLLGLALERIERQGIRQMDPGPGFAWFADPAQSAATEDDSWRHRVLVGEVHDDNCSALEGAGHAGLFGTADAILDFAKDRLADTGPDAPIRTPLSARRTHGWERPYEGWSGGELCSPATIGHTGFTGTGLWIDFERGCAWTLLTNRVHPTRHFDSGIVALRRAVGDLINSD
jgi:CubicO group peptidase (beta-lactamase class C family)